MSTTQLEDDLAAALLKQSKEINELRERADTAERALAQLEANSHVFLGTCMQTVQDAEAERDEARALLRRALAICGGCHKGYPAFLDACRKAGVVSS